MLSTPPPTLSKREKQILQLVSDGNTSAEIAQLLDLSKHTVDNHRKNMLVKTETSNSIELLFWALKQGIIKA